jgi:cyclase
MSRSQRFPPRRLATVAAMLAFAGAPTSSRAQRPAWAQNLDTVPVRAERVAQNIYLLHGAGSDITVAVGPDGALLVDAGLVQQGPKVVAAVRALTDRPIRYVIDTHFHFDHSEGNEALARAGAVLVSHENLRRRLATPQMIEIIAYEQKASPVEGLPALTFTDSVTFRLNGDTVTAFHVPRAHTDGDAVVHFRRANVLSMGDLFMSPAYYPFLHLRAGASIDGLVAGIERAIAISDERTRVIPGHGPVSDRGALRAYRDMLVTVRDRVRRHVASGATLQAVLAARPSAEFDAKWGTGITAAQFVEAVFRSVSQP